MFCFSVLETFREMIHSQKGQCMSLVRSSPAYCFHPETSCFACHILALM